MEPTIVTPTQRSENSENEDNNITSTDFSGPILIHDKVLSGILGLTMNNSRIAVLRPHRIIIRSDYPDMFRKVKLLSGGCAGYEPLFSGFVGYGLLTAVVYGDSFGGPSAREVLIALRELSCPEGIVIIIMNKLDERLNFGLAMEQARTEGITVDMVIVGDDCYECQSSDVGRRSLSGIIPVIKVAGSMSEAGKSMREIFIMCRAMILTSLSVTISKNVVTSFGTDLNGNGGIEIKDLYEDDMVKEMLLYMVNAKKYLSASIFPFNKFIVIVNTYKNDQILLGNLCREVMYQLDKMGLCVERMYCNTFISGRKPGFSITLVKDLEEELLEWFDTAVPSRYWPECVLQKPKVIKTLFLSDVLPGTGRICGTLYVNGPLNSNKFIAHCEKCLEFACRALISSEIMFNEIDPQGHYGNVVAKTARELLEHVKDNKLQYDRPFVLMKQISYIFEEHMKGEIGTLFCLFFTGIAMYFLRFTSNVVVCFENWCKAIKKGITTTASMSHLEPGNCTLIDALCPFYRGLMEKPESDFNDRIQRAVECAEIGVEGTTIMNSVRHIYSMPEPGAQTVATAARAIIEAIKKCSLEEETLFVKEQPLTCPYPYGIVPERTEISLPPYIENEEFEGEMEEDLFGEQVGEEFDEELQLLQSTYEEEAEEILRSSESQNL